MKIEHYLGKLPIGKATAVIVGAVGGYSATGLTLAAVLILSNALSLGSAQLQGTAVQLTEVDQLPATMFQDKEERVRFDILETSGADHVGTSLKVRLTAEDPEGAPVPLLEPSIISMRYEDKTTGASTDSVTLITADGSLEGALLSEWDIPASYSSTGELFVTFNSANSPPLAAYSAKVWVERDDGNVVGTLHEVQATDDLVFVPETITINAGDTARWNNTGTKPHSVTFADTSIASKDFLDGGATYQVTFNQAGTFSYQCIFHDGMVGTITVNP